MPRYIDAYMVDDLFEPFADVIENTEQRSAFLQSLQAVQDAPTIDAVSVVRCKDCKYYDKFPTWSACTYWNGDPYEQASVNADDFCSYGERKETDHE